MNLELNQFHLQCVELSTTTNFLILQTYSAGTES